MSDRRTKRRYAHELYPHAEEFEVRPLAVEVPYLYARAFGLDVTGTGWFTAETDVLVARTNMMLDARHIALMADAMLQGLTGQDAHEWVERHRDYEGEMFWDVAVKHVPNQALIKPYPCGATPDHHDHMTPMDPANPDGWQTVTRVDGLEADCDECTEPVPAS